MKSGSIILTGLACAVVVLAGGCGESGARLVGERKVILPPEVVGIWRANDSPWVIELSPDGKVVKALVPMTESEIRPNQTTKVKMADGSTSTLKAGDCPVEYNLQTRELTVTIELKAFHVRYYEERIDGNSTDMFIGQVSQDGRTWYADWMTFFDYGPRFPQDKNDPNDIFMGSLLFRKVIKQP